MENNAAILRAEFSRGKVYEDCEIMKSGTSPGFFRTLFLWFLIYVFVKINLCLERQY